MSFAMKRDRPRGTIWLIGADGKHARPLTGAAPSTKPRWSPDGTRLAYLGAGADGSTQLFVYWTDSGATAAISNFTESPSRLPWSPDRRWPGLSLPVPAQRKPPEDEMSEAPQKPH